MLFRDICYLLSSTCVARIESEPGLQQDCKFKSEITAISVTSTEIMRERERDLIPPTTRPFILVEGI